MMSDAAWYYAVGSEQRGPVSTDDIALLIGRGEIGPHTLMWREGMSEWGAARASLPGSMVPQSWVDGLSASPTAPRPPQLGEQAHASAGSDGMGDPGFGGDATYHPTQFADVIRTVFGRYVQFRGRARRSEYWYWILFVVLVSIALAIVDGFIFGFDENDLAVLGPLFSLGTFLPSLAVGFRRMHDLGRTAWWLLIGFIPLIGSLILIYWFAQRGDEGDNQYGPA
jgi:uncharacterized membrane protein YhaH (DUF805 family)